MSISRFVPSGGHLTISPVMQNGLSNKDLRVPSGGLNFSSQSTNIHLPYDIVPGDIY